MMKALMTLFAVLALALAANAQVPQFSSRSYAGWEYSDYSLELNASSILNNRVVLYINSLGRALTLTSPRFNCRAGETIDMNVTWITDQWQSEGFVMNRVALTAALLDKNGVTVDSVTWVPTSLSRTNMVNMSLMVPKSLTDAQLRFASWKADVNSNGAVRQIDMTSQLRGDVNNDGEVTIADVNAIIDVVLQEPDDEALMARADVNRDDEVTIADINQVLDFILK